jgi:hypothetical protein
MLLLDHHQTRAVKAAVVAAAADNLEVLDVAEVEAQMLKKMKWTEEMIELML